MLLAVVVVAALAVAVSAIVLWVLRDDGGDDRAAIEGATTEIPSTSDVAGGRRSAALAATGELRMPTAEGVTVPTFPQVGDVAPRRSDMFGLLPAVVGFDGDVPRRSTTNVVLGQGGFELDAVILRDPVSDRYEIEIEVGGRPERAIVDVETRTIYLSGDGERWFAHTMAPDVDRSGPLPLGELYRMLLDGPLRADTIFDAEVVRTGTVELDAGRRAQAFRVALPAAEIPLWRLYHFAPAAEFDPADLPTSMVYDVYINDDTQVLVGLSAIGNVAQLVQHRVELLPERVGIELPDAGSIDPPTG